MAEDGAPAGSTDDDDNDKNEPSASSTTHSARTPHQADALSAAFGIYRLVFQSQRGLLSRHSRSNSPATSPRTRVESNATPPEFKDIQDAASGARVERRATIHAPSRGEKTQSAGPPSRTSPSLAKPDGVQPNQQRRRSLVLSTALKPFKALRRKLVESKRVVESEGLRAIPEASSVSADSHQAPPPQQLQQSTPTLESVAGDISSPASSSSSSPCKPSSGSRRSAALESKTATMEQPDLIRAGFLFVQLFAIRGKADVQRTFYVLLTKERFSLLLSDEIGAQPLASVLLTELNDIKTEERVFGDGNMLLREKSCSLFSHTVPYCTFWGPQLEIDSWFADISKAMKDSFDMLISLAVPKMSLVEHRRASSLKEQYQIQGDRGIGGSAFIKTAINKESGRPVIVKFVNKSLSETGQDGLPVEVSTLLSTKHANIVEVKEVYETHDYYIIVMDKFGEGYDLFDYIQNAERLPEHEARHIFRQVVNAVGHLAENNIVHGDIKDENIIIDGSTGQIKLIDFGSNKHFQPEDHFEKYTGTPQMACPEAASNQPFNPVRQELWSLGVLLYILLTGEYPFDTVNDIKEGNIKRIDDDILLEVSEESLDVIERLLEPDVTKQMTLLQLRSHPWLLRDS